MSLTFLNFSTTLLLRRLKTEKMSKNYIKALQTSSVHEVQQQLEEEIELRTFAQQQWDEEAEKHLLTQSNLLQHVSTIQVLKQDVSGLMTEMKKRDVFNVQEIKKMKKKEEETSIEISNQWNLKMQDDVLAASMNVQQEWQNKLKVAVSNAQVEMFDVQRKQAHIELEQKENVMEEMRENHLIEIQLGKHSKRTLFRKM